MIFRYLLIFATLLTVTTSAHAQQTGMPACDEYLNMIEACLRKLGVTDQTKYQDLAKMRADYKVGAANPNMKPHLETLCKTAMDAAKAGQGNMPQHCAQ